MTYIDPLAQIARGSAFVDNIFTQRANKQAGQRLRSRDYSGASDALLSNGDLQGGMALQNAGQARQQADAAKQWEFTLKATNALEGVLAQGGDVVAAYDQLAPVFQQMGTTPEQVQALRQSLAANPAQFLQSVRATVPVEYEFRDGGAGDVVRVNKRTGEAERAYDAPDRPIATQFGIILPPGAGGSVAPTAAGSQPMTGPANISDAPLYNPSSMVGITSQSESGNRERDANGNLITSPAGARGRMQVMPGTNRDPGYGVTPARDNSDAERTRVGEEYLSAMMREYGGDPAKAWAAYNWGPGNLDRAIAQHGGDWLNYAPAETRSYVANNLRQLNGAGGQAAPIEQGDAIEQDSTLDLGGGFRLQPIQTEADRRAARSEQRANSAEARAQASFERQNAPVATLSAAEVASLGLPEGAVAQRRADGSINVVSRGGSERFTEGQRLSASFYHRALGAEQNIDRLSRVGNGRPSAAVLAFGEGRIRENALSPTDRQWVQASRDWLAPILRRDTGAAVSPGELVTYMGTYIPNPTDDAATLQQKADSRRRAQEGLRGTAGGAYQELLQTLGQDGQAGNGGRRRTNAPGLPFDVSPGQLQTRQRLAQSGASPSAPVGSERNPRYMNPADPNSSWTNARSGDYLVRPDGRLVRKP